MRGIEKKRTRLGHAGQAVRARRATSSRRVASRSATASSASSSTAAGSRQPGSPAAWSAPAMKVRSSSGRASCSALSVSTVKDRPRAVDLDARTPRCPGASPTASRHSSSRTPAPGSASSSLCGGVWTGSSSTRSSSSAVSASCAHTMCPTCGGLNVPPRRPIRATQGRSLAVALDQVLERAQLAQADRAARVELLGRVADLGAHAELAAVGEARRGVDVDAGGVDAELERARRRRRCR